MEILMPVATVSSLSATVDVIFLPLAKCAICYLVYKKNNIKTFLTTIFMPRFDAINLFISFQSFQQTS